MWPRYSSEAFVATRARIIVVDDDPLLGESAMSMRTGAQVGSRRKTLRRFDLLSAGKSLTSRGRYRDAAHGRLRPGERLRAQETLRHLPGIWLTVRGDPDSIDNA